MPALRLSTYQRNRQCKGYRLQDFQSSLLIAVQRIVAIQVDRPGSCAAEAPEEQQCAYSDPQPHIRDIVKQYGVP